MIKRYKKEVRVRLVMVIFKRKSVISGIIIIIFIMPEIMHCYKIYNTFSCI